MSKSKPFGSAMGVGCLMLFALPFAAVGVGMVGWLVRDLALYQSAKSWFERPATLLEAKLVESNDSDGGTTYRATARYEYTFDDKRYESTRVSLHSGSDNVGSYQRDRGRELEQLKRQGRPTVAYVNPDDPHEAMLYRDLRPGMVIFKAMFGLVFGTVGLGLMAGAWIGGRQLRRQEQLKKQLPDEPWQWRDDWRAGRIRTSAGPIWLASLFAIIWNCISWPAIVLAATSGEITLPILLLIGLFPAVGTGLAAWTGYLWLQRWKWGVSEFEMAAVPGVLGGPLAGVIHVPARIESQDGVILRLTCVRSEQDGENTREVTLWESEKQINRDLALNDRTVVPVQFIIPLELPASGEGDVKWKLTARAATTGVDYGAVFEVPVFRTAASSSNVSAEVEENLTLFSPLSLSKVACGAGATIEEDFPDRKVLYFPAARNRGMAIGLSLFTLIWTGIGVALLYSEVPPVIAWGMCSIGALLAWLTTYVVLERGRLEYGKRGVACWHAALRSGRRSEFSPEEIASIAAEPSGSSSNGVPFWNVVLHARDGEKHKLATELPRRQHAEYLAQQIAKAVGLSDSRKGDPQTRNLLEAELPASMQGE